MIEDYRLLKRKSLHMFWHIFCKWMLSMLCRNSKKKETEVFSYLHVEKTRFFQRVQEFLSLSLNSRTVITNMPKLSIRDRTSKVSIHPSPPNTQPSQTSVCPIQNQNGKIFINSCNISNLNNGYCWFPSEPLICFFN